MKTRLGFVQLFLLGFFASVFVLSESDRQGAGPQRLPGVVQSWIVGKLTDIRFAFRGPVSHEATPLVIVEIDDLALQQLGRWPWKRNLTSDLIESIMKFDPKAVGLDIVFSEYEEVFPESLRSEMQQKGIDTTAYDHDPVLWQTISNHSSKLILGAFATPVRPIDYAKDFKKIAHKMNPPWLDDDEIAMDSFHHFSIGKIQSPSPLKVEESGLYWIHETLHNIPEISLLAKYQGVLNAEMDSDGVIRRSPLLFASQGHWYPSLGLELFRVFNSDDIDVDLNAKGRISRVQFKKSKRRIDLNHDGVAQVNYSASRYHYIKATDLLCAAESKFCPPSPQRSPASLEVIREKIQGSAVLVGLTALGVFDMRSFPYGVNIPGLEGHAAVFDNLIREVFFWTPIGDVWIFGQVLGLVLLGLIFVMGLNRFKALSGVIWFFAFLLTFLVIDFYILFSKSNILLNTGTFYFQLVSVFGVTFIAKYMSEEKSKQFVKEAFGKYLSPVLVDSIIKDPSMLQLGGEKKELTILFSDIRGFTTFSEKMDPKQLAQFLNDYLGIMTDIVFECNGTLDKYIGDAVMSFWGAPLNQPDHGLRALQAAVKMIQRLRLEQPRWKEVYGVDVEIGVGLNSGPVNVGNMGSTKIFEYTVIGDHVNLASRLEGLTKTYGVGILTTRFTLDSIENAGMSPPMYRVLDFVKVKGKKQAIELIEVLTEEVDPRALDCFEKARILYSERKFDEAIRLFEDAYRFFQGKDGPSEMFISRCRYFIDSPPSDEWDGSWEMQSK